MATPPFSVPAIAGVAHGPRRRPWRGVAVGLVLGLGLGLGLGAVARAMGAEAVGQTPSSGAALAGSPAPGGAPPSGRPVVSGGAPATGVAPGVPGAPVEPLSEAAFSALLKLDDFDQLNLACARVLQDDNPTRLRLLQDHLLALRPAPQPLPVLLANAEVLLSCRGPHAALAVLDRYGPGPGAARVQWLLMQWRAASAALEHRRASLALDRLTAGSEARLRQLTLPIRRREDGTVVSRAAVDVLAGHLEARGFAEAAGQLLLRDPTPGVPGAERLGRAVALLRQLPVAEREAILETALNQAAAAGAWSLVSDLLEAQAALPSSRARVRRLRLSPRLDDAYGEWRLLQADPTARGRARQLERQLRSPQDPGGHADPNRPISTDAAEADPPPLAPAVPAAAVPFSSPPAPSPPVR